jgi:hypothetical protein
VAAALFVVVGFADGRLSKQRFPAPAVTFPGRPWLDGWVRWDSGWYGQIASRGY